MRDVSNCGLFFDLSLAFAVLAAGFHASIETGAPIWLVMVTLVVAGDRARRSDFPTARICRRIRPKSGSWTRFE